MPGQSMAMDRKNKKAAQAAANAVNGSSRDGGRGGRTRGHGHQPSTGGSRNALFSGSTAPTRTASNPSRTPMPMPLKASLSPSAPAPPVKDTDFVAFNDETDKLPSAPAQGKNHLQSSVDDALGSALNSKEEVLEDTEQRKADIPSSLPLSTPRAVSVALRGSPGTIDLGPIGSPPRSSPAMARTLRKDGLSPGQSPPGLSHSPFSAPGSQSVFGFKDESPNDFRTRSGLSASLGSMLSWDRQPTQKRQVSIQRMVGEIVVEDEDLEEFIPGSLTDLLTPEERSRRFSRTQAAHPTVTGVELDTAAAGQRPSGEGHQHRYSRSVPAPSLLQDIKSIWSTDGAAGSPDATGSSIPAVTGGGLGNGTPSSFQSNSGLAARVEDMLSPSNASAAFLPGLHQYMNAAKVSQRPHMMSGLTSGYHTAASVNLGISSSAYAGGLNGGALSPPRLNSYMTARMPLDGNDPFFSPASNRLSGRPIPAGNGFSGESDDRRSALSPSARALQAHAPGQSLPQGLAAGYSRIHALPPPPTIPSPSTSSAFGSVHLGGFSPGAKGISHTANTSGEWQGIISGMSNMTDHNPTQAATAGNPGLDSMFSRLSYSAATSRKSYMIWPCSMTLTRFWM